MPKRIHHTLRYDGHGDGAHDPGVHRRPPRAAFLHEPAPRQQIGDGARRRPMGNPRMMPGEYRKQLPGAPVGMGDTLADEQRLHRRLNLVRAVMRDMTPIGQAAPTVRLIPREPLVADPATHAIACTEFTHREPIAVGVAHKLQPFVHRSTLPPWNRRPR